MTLTARQETILARLGSDGEAQVDALAAEHGVSTQTIRKDLNALCQRGLARRVHGGVRAGRTVANLDYAARREMAGPAKAAIGAAAAALIPHHCSVMLNIGTTTEQVAGRLFRHEGLVVISNNINIITTLIGSPARELILAGGAVRPEDGAIVGADAVEFISRYKADFAIIGASSLDEDGAVLDFDGREVSVARAILRNARVRVLVADATKFARTAPVRICGIGEIDHFVTDAPPPASFLRAAEEAGTDVLIAGMNDGG